MQSMTLEAYGPGSPYLKAMLLAEAKSGKTTFIVMSLLGLWPWQTQGGVVSDPAHLHVLAIDQDCLDRIAKLMQLAGVPEKTIAYVLSRLHVISLRDDVARVLDCKTPYNHAFLNALKVARQDVVSKVKKGETHALVLSSVTGTLKVNERALFGEPTGISGGKGYGSKDLWTLLQGHAAEIQNIFQVDLWHFFAEGHVFSVQKEGGGNVDSLLIHGSGRNWPVNTSHNLRMVRETISYKGPEGRATAIQPVYLDMKPSYSFIPSGGRGTAGAAEKVYDLAAFMMDAGYQVGGWRMAP